MFCIKKGQTKYCINQKPLMNHNTIINTFLTEMKNYRKHKRNEPFFYLSPQLKETFGGLKGFEKYIFGNNKKYLVNLESYKIIEVNKINDTKVEFLVGITNSESNDIYIYKFILLRMYDYKNRKPLYDRYSQIHLNLYWRINRISLVRINPSMVLEGFSNNLNLNLDSEELKVCGLDPMTGFFRDGFCKTDETDSGTHTVCAKVTDEFLQYTKNKGNDLITPRGSFKGLKSGDKWCLCSIRWDEANKDGKAPPVDLKATNKKTLEYVSLNELRKKQIRN
jgi:uncharacterized protein (DUF2237 family)